MNRWERKFLIELTPLPSNSCLLLLQGNRDENQNVNHQLAQEDAQRLYQAGEGKLGTDESCFNMILATRSFPQLRATMEAYSRVWVFVLRSGFCFKVWKDFNPYTFCLQMANRDLFSSVGREFSGNVENGLKAIRKTLFCFALFCL